VTAATFADAEKLMRVQMSPEQRTQAAGNWRDSMAPLYERRAGPRRSICNPGSRRTPNGIRCCPGSVQRPGRIGL
jgi:hypothetical protein